MTHSNAHNILTSSRIQTCNHSGPGLVHAPDWTATVFGLMYSKIQIWYYFNL